MGASSGLAGANVLGRRLEQHGDDVTAALDDWEQTMRPRITQFQKFGRQGIHVFTPSTAKGVRVRARVMSAMTKPVIRDLFARVGKWVPAMRAREKAIV